MMRSKLQKTYGIGRDMKRIMLLTVICIFFSMPSAFSAPAGSEQGGFIQSPKADGYYESMVLGEPVAPAQTTSERRFEYAIPGDSTYTYIVPGYAQECITQIEKAFPVPGWQQNIARYHKLIEAANERDRIRTELGAEIDAVKRYSRSLFEQESRAAYRENEAKWKQMLQQSLAMGEEISNIRMEARGLLQNVKHKAVIANHDINKCLSDAIAAQQRKLEEERAQARAVVEARKSAIENEKRQKELNQFLADMRKKYPKAVPCDFFKLIPADSIIILSTVPGYITGIYLDGYEFKDWHYANWTQSGDVEIVSRKLREHPDQVTLRQGDGSVCTFNTRY